MKLFCIEFESCGFFTPNPDEELYQSLTCPWCYSPLLIYEDNDIPKQLNNKFNKETSNEEITEESD
jgi:hypothetical protein